MKFEYWTIAVIFTAFGLILYSHINETIRNRQHYEIEIKQVNALSEANSKVCELNKELAKAHEQFRA